jgi:hypothetical protein
MRGGINNHISTARFAALLVSRATNPLATLIAVGTLVGVGYAIDVGASDALIAGAVGSWPIERGLARWSLCFWRLSRGSPCIIISALAEPSGSANAQTAYFQWPGSPLIPRI